MTDNQSTEKNRGGCITAFLIFMFIINPLLTIYYLLAGDFIKQNLPGIPDWALPVLAIFGLINLGLAIAIWKWKRIGIYGLWISAVAVLFINLAIGLTPVQSFMGLLGPLIITLLVRPKWADFT